MGIRPQVKVKDLQSVLGTDKIINQLQRWGRRIRSDHNRSSARAFKRLQQRKPRLGNLKPGIISQQQPGLKNIDIAKRTESFQLLRFNFVRQNDWDVSSELSQRRTSPGRSGQDVQYREFEIFTRHCAPRTRLRRNSARTTLTPGKRLIRMTSFG